ncbi:sulfotransferase [Blastococcus sp. URHD0036]|uniref:sulfotransferase family protein n=1 Tax=Blastococcus sp. URHD0036 TaxID=1380356 RepID=UPI0004984816|nr:sulfotransferase [Blastococcus sp. URHD0036]
MTLDVGALVAEARRRTGLDDLGPDTWQEGLTALVDSLNSEAALTAQGEAFHAGQIVDQLAARLEFERSWAEHPEIADEQIVAPLVGLGLGRTGSTALGFVLAQDPGRRVLRTWEAWFPSPPPEKATEHSDPRIARTRERVEAMWRDFPGYREMVPLDAEGPNECVYLLAFDFRSQLFESWGRIPSYGAWLFGCDMTPAYRYHRRVLQMLQWRCGPKNWFVRSPPHLHAMTALDAVYPDARFVQTHRAVEAMIPSEAALFSSLLTPLTTEPDLPYLGRHLADVRVECLRRLLAFRDAGNADRFFDIGFADMQADPMGQVRALYAWLGEDLSDVAAERMTAWWDANSRDRQGARRHEPETYGVTADDLRRRFAFYSERFPAFTRTSRG